MKGKIRVLHEAKMEEMDSLRPKPLTLDKISEEEEQKAVIVWAVYNMKLFPSLRWLYHPPNGGSRHPAEAVNLKKMGVKAGVPDLCLPVARKGYNGLYIEMKSHKGRVSPLQQEWLDGLCQNGYMAVVCHGAEEAIKVLKFYLED